MKRKIAAAVSHHEREVEELRADHQLAAEYLKAAMESLGDVDDRAAGLLALRTIADAHLNLEQRLAAYDPARHGGEVMGASEHIGAERW